MSFEQNYGISDPNVEIGYDETDELFLRKIYIETLYELYLQEKEEELKRLLEGANKK